MRRDRSPGAPPVEPRLNASDLLVRAPQLEASVKRIVAHEGRPVVIDVPEPELRANEVLVETAFSAVSVGTETGILRESAFPPGSERRLYLRDLPEPKLRSMSRTPVGPEPRSTPPGYEAIGYSLSGRVLAVAPEVVDLKPGDLVACSGAQCSVHAERVAVPRNLVAPVPEGVTLPQAAFVTLGTISMNSLRLTGCQFGETVVLYGLGLLGLLATQIARSAGIHVVGIDLDAQRRADALRYGARRVVDPAAEDPVRAVLAETDGFGADGVIVAVATESSEPLNLAFDMSRHHGTVVGLGAFGMNVDRQRFGSTDTRLIMCRAYGPGRYDPVYEEGSIDFPIGYVRWTEGRNQAAFLRLIAEGRVAVDALAPRRFSLDEVTAAYDLVRSPARPPTVLFDYGRG